MQIDGNFLKFRILKKKYFDIEIFDIFCAYTILLGFFMGIRDEKIFSKGLSVDSLISDFGQCLDFVKTANSMIYVPKLSQIVQFDWSDFFANIIDAVFLDGSKLLSALQILLLQFFRTYLVY